MMWRMVTAAMDASTVNGTYDAGAHAVRIIQVHSSVLTLNSVDPPWPKRAIDAFYLIGMGSSASI